MKPFATNQTGERISQESYLEKKPYFFDPIFVKLRQDFKWSYYHCLYEILLALD